ncbi:unnamed protein product [Arabidopsis halleri]
MGSVDCLMTDRVPQLHAAPRSYLKRFKHSRIVTLRRIVNSHILWNATSSSSNIFHKFNHRVIRQSRMRQRT